jgi:GTP-binding protein Era
MPALKPGSGDAFVLDLIGRAGTSTVLVLNKIDQIDKPRLLPLMQQYAAALPFKAIVPISALTGRRGGGLLQAIVAALPEGQAAVSRGLPDRSERAPSGRRTRARKVLHHTRDELPYSTAVLIEQFEEPKTEGGLTRIFASILVDQASQKPIVVGKGGEMIKRIGIEAAGSRRDARRPRLPRASRQSTEDWRDDERLLNEMGLGRR